MVKVRWFANNETNTRAFDTYQMARAEVTRLLAEGFERALILEATRAGKWHVTFDSASGY